MQSRTAEALKMRNYYIIGSKGRSQDGKWDDVWNEMKDNNCVSIGYVPKHNLTRLYGEAEDTIVAALRKGKNNVSRRAHSLFLNLRPGDIVAVKKFAAPKRKTPRLAIHAYAVVRARAGRVYRYHRGTHFPHQIGVKFIERKEHKFPWPFQLEF